MSGTLCSSRFLVTEGHMKDPPSQGGCKVLKSFGLFLPKQLFLKFERRCHLVTLHPDTKTTSQYIWVQIDITDKNRE